MTTLNDYCRREFGKKLYKLSLDAGFTCPNRDGTLGFGGCIFCPADGGGAFAGRGMTLDEQIEDAKRRVAAKNKNGGYIAYFQSFSNTYAPVEKLKELYYPVIKRPDIDVLDIATRPDCLPDEVIALLKELNAIKPVWVELGLQTTKPESVAYIRRGYDTPVYDDAVKRLKEAGLYVVTHVILGLPGESTEDMKTTVSHAVSAGTDGLKLHLLHVLKNADLAAEYAAGRFETMTLDGYVEALRAVLPLVPDSVTVHRLTGDGDKRNLVSPLWSGDKKRVLNRLKKEFGI
ncbi:MAG: TIGR01212 family radical SAM protein [Clostridia bacterium]|nr:TIGR01212 family radical SAM protein [Clostridia bacterium]